MIIKYTFAILFIVFSAIISIVSLINFKNYDNAILVISLVINCLIFVLSLIFILIYPIDSNKFKVITIVLSLALIIAGILNGLGQNNLHLTHHLIRILILLIYIFIICK